MVLGVQYLLFLIIGVCARARFARTRSGDIKDGWLLAELEMMMVMMMVMMMGMGGGVGGE